MRVTLVAGQNIGRAVNLEDAKLHLRVDDGAEDPDIDAKLRAAVRWAEGFTHRAFVQRQYDGALTRFPRSDVAAIRTPFGNLVSLQTITYLDGNGATQTLYDSTSSPTIVANIQVDNSHDEEGLLFLEPGVGWPDTESDRQNAVALTFTAGYGTAADIPEDIVEAIKYKLADLFEIRSSVDGGQVRGFQPSGREAAAKAMLLPHIVRRFWIV